MNLSIKAIKKLWMKKVMSEIEHSSMNFLIISKSRQTRIPLYFSLLHLNIFLFSQSIFEFLAALTSIYQMEMD